MSSALDLHTTPFSRFGAYLAISHLPAQDSGAQDSGAQAGLPEGLYLRSLRGPLVGPSPWQPLFQMQLLVGGEVLPAAETTVTALPTRLRLAHGATFVELCFETADRLRLQGVGAGLRLLLRPGGYDFALPYAGGQWQVVLCSSVETKFMAGSLRGSVEVASDWNGLRATRLELDLLPAADGSGDWFLDEYTVTWPAVPLAESYASAAKAVDAEFAAWVEGCTHMAPDYPAAAASAAYVTWSCVVAPSGHLRRRAMYMSKNAMASIWSWDNCFNALALAHHAPDLAWDQLMVLADLQHPSGVLPDLANDRYISWSFCKPPVYGWALRRLAEAPGFLTPARLEEIYPRLCRSTEWWFERRDDNGDGIPQYNHGNESGWDNSTVFRGLPPVDAPDLCTYLVLQMEFLATAAAQLGRQTESRAWRERGEGLLDALLRTFWRGDRFVARASVTGEEIDCDSLLLFIPLLLGKRLPPEVRAALTARLRDGAFLTPYGVASEATSSPFYVPDGYWRGPLWGAPTVMLVEGLAAVGEHALAEEVRRRFCRLVAERGMAENYDALTGAPLRDRAFTWTASAFLLLAGQSAG
jgi:hypothetical protein